MADDDFRPRRKNERTSDYQSKKIEHEASGDGSGCLVVPVAILTIAAVLAAILGHKYGAAS